MIKLSQCMIVKNEEANIEKALSWAKDIAYEQIVVDTGSTDRTVEIAEKMGAKVYHFEWIDDFSAAKNYAIEKATGDWIAFLDADEYFNEEDTKKLMNYLEELQNSNYMAVVFSLWNLNDEGKAFTKIKKTRVFRNIDGLQYYGSIHEDLLLNGQSVIPSSINADGLTIFHTGYAQSVSKTKKKGERNIQILLKEIEKDPKNRWTMGYLGDAYFIDGKHDEAIKWFEKSVDSLSHPFPVYDMRISINFTNLMKALYNVRNFERFLKVYEQAVQVVPEEADFDYLVGHYWMMEKNDFEKAVFHIEQALQKLKSEDGNFCGQTLLGQMQKALELCAICYYHLQNWGKCMENCIAILKEDVYRFSVTKILLQVFQIDEQKGGASAREVLLLLSKLYALQHLKDRIYLLKAATEIQYDSFILELRNLFTPEELAAIDGSIGK